MRHTLLTLSILLTAIVAQATPITEAEARSNVWQFLNSKGKQKIKGARSLTLAHTIYKGGESQADGSPMLYVFNVNGDQGFVVASADDVALPILAYGNEGGFSQGEIPDNVGAWLQGYADQIAEARASGAQRVERPAKANRHSVDHMVQVQWDQRAPYNDQCVFDGHQCSTGCVATAMAQIMYYWGVTGRDGNKFRHGCQALKSYTTWKSGYEVPALDALDSFDWNAMDEGTATPQSDAAKHAVAQLMRYCGQSALMDYTTGESSAYPSDAVSGMIKFGYDSNMKYIDAYNYFSDGPTYDKWDEILYKEIRKGRPVLMGISMRAMKHSFVCDGYDAENNSFYLNWGWSGDDDGYYVLSATLVNSGATARSYSAIVGIEPETSTYGVLSSNGHTLTLYYDNKKEQRQGEIVECYVQTGESSELLTWAEALGDKVEQVRTIVIDKSFKYTSNTLRQYFRDFSEVVEIEGLEYMDTYGVSNFEEMFDNCYSLQYLDLSKFDTSQATDMENMFYNCFYLREIDLSSFDTSNVRKMDGMFANCRFLRKLDVSHFDTSNVAGMNRMFQSCASLLELDLSNFVIKDDSTDPDTSDEEEWWSRRCDTGGMLYGCSDLRKLHISPSMVLLEDKDEFTVPACKTVGSESKPCVVIAPSGFDFGTDTGSTFQWKGGWFHLPYPLGDINHDEQVNVTDVSLLVDYILKGAIEEWHPDEIVLFDSYLPRFYLGYDMEEADINHDRDVNITDVTNLVNIILK